MNIASTSYPTQRTGETPSRSSTARQSGYLADSFLDDIEEAVTLAALDAADRLVMRGHSAQTAYAFVDRMMAAYVAALQEETQ